jgi:hypothetical protein
VIEAVTLLCGTSTISSSAETTWKTELLDPNKTAEAPGRFMPVISTREPSGPLVGEIRRISGRVVWAHKLESNAA